MGNTNWSDHPVTAGSELQFKASPVQEWYFPLSSYTNNQRRKYRSIEVSNMMNTMGKELRSEDQNHTETGNGVLKKHLERYWEIFDDFAAEDSGVRP